MFLTAGGQRYTEEHAQRLAQYDNLTLVCGHYEGIDERVIDAFADEEISIGDYILTGGELASLVVADSVLRLKPGVLAEQKGYEEESYWDGLLEYPQYTRPEVSGRAAPCRRCCWAATTRRSTHGAGEQSRERTRLRRPELYEQWCETTLSPSCPSGSAARTCALSRPMSSLPLPPALCGGTARLCAGTGPGILCQPDEELFLLQLQGRKKRPQAGPATCTPPRMCRTAW